MRQYFFKDGNGMLTGKKIRIVGKPALNRLQYFTLIVKNTANEPISGELWIDELRLSGIKKEKGVAMRVPTPNVSLVELVFCTKKDLTKEKINLAFEKFVKNQNKKILEITYEKLVSIDFNHNSASSIVDASLTNVIGKNMGKISAWYDNEWGFSNRMCDLAEYIHKSS